MIHINEIVKYSNFVYLCKWKCSYLVEIKSNIQFLYSFMNSVPVIIIMENDNLVQQLWNLTPSVTLWSHFFGHRPYMCCLLCSNLGDKGKGLKAEYITTPAHTFIYIHVHIKLVGASYKVMLKKWKPENCINKMLGWGRGHWHQLKP